MTFGTGEPEKEVKDGKEVFIVGERYKPDAQSVLLDTDAKTGHGLSTAIGEGADGWTLLKTEITGCPDEKQKMMEKPEAVQGYVVYTYAYNSMVADVSDKLVKEKFKEQIADKVLVPKTTSLFTKVRLINCVEGQLDKVKLQVPVKTFAIQAAHTGNDADKDNNDIPKDTKTVIQYAKNAFEKYANQNEDNGTASVSADSFVVHN